MGAVDRGPVVVVGARCAGATTAMLLARSGHEVVLVDRARFPSDTLSTHGFVRGGVVQLARWGLLDAVLASGAPAVREVTFRQGDDEVVRVVKDRAGVDLLVAPRRHLLDTLVVRAAEDAGATVHLGTTVEDVLRDDGGRVCGVVTRDRSGETRVRPACFVVGADGLRSRVASRVGAQVTELHVRDSSIFYAYVRELDAGRYEFHVGASVRGLAGVFPTNDDMACVWLCSPASSLGALRSSGASRVAAFVDAVAQRAPSLAARLRRGTFTSPVRGAVGLPNQVRRAAGPGWALVGDASSHRDPVTGHGITDAFRDAELLVHALDSALRGRVSEHEALRSYDIARNAALRETFALTCSLAAYPPPARFVELQLELGAAIDAEATALARFPRLPGPPAVAA